MPKTKKAKKREIPKPKFKSGDAVWFVKANGEWDKGEVEWSKTSFKGTRYFIGKCKYAQQVFSEEYLFTEKEMKKIVGAKDG